MPGVGNRRANRSRFEYLNAIPLRIAAESGPPGMACPKCGGRTGVSDSRSYPENTIRRRRRCEGCGHRFTTFEIAMEMSPARLGVWLRKQAQQLRIIANAVEKMSELDVESTDTEELTP